jgi:hypothetical protein
MVRQNYPSAPLTLRRRFRPSQPSLRLLWPLLTSRSSLRRRPFRHEARYPQVRTQSFPAQPPNLRRLILDHKSFAVACPLALIGNASYPVLVHRLAVSIHTSFPQSVALPQLRFTSFAVVSLREDFHLQDCAHAGRTNANGPNDWGRFYVNFGRTNYAASNNWPISCWASLIDLLRASAPSAKPSARIIVTSVTPTKPSTTFR